MIRSLSVATFPLLFLLDPGWAELKQFTPTIIMAFLLLWFVLKITPQWRAVKLREMEIREAEITQLSTFASASDKLADVVREIAIEQRLSSEALRIGERVNERAGRTLKGDLEDMSTRLDQLAAESKAKQDES